MSERKQESIIEGLLIAMDQAQTDEDRERINDAISCINSLTTIIDQADARIAELEEQLEGSITRVRAELYLRGLLRIFDAHDTDRRKLEVLKKCIHKCLTRLCSPTESKKAADEPGADEYR